MTTTPDDPNPGGNPALAAATEAILRRRLAATWGSGDQDGRRAAMLLDALPDAAAALDAAAPAIRAAERERIRQMAASHGARYDETKPCSCGRTRPDGTPCVVLLRSGLPFAGLLETS